MDSIYRERRLPVAQFSDSSLLDTCDMDVLFSMLQGSRQRCCTTAGRADSVVAVVWCTWDHHPLVCPFATNDVNCPCRRQTHLRPFRLSQFGCRLNSTIAFFGESRTINNFWGAMILVHGQFRQLGLALYGKSKGF
jgi:hypothetical protein